MSTTRLLGALASALLAASLFGAVPASAKPAATAAGSADSAPVAAISAAAVDPKRDFPRLPRKCATPRELIPQQPMKCNLNEFDRSRPTVVLWGDSHVWQLIPGVRLAAQDRDVNLVAFMLGSCPVMDPNLTKRQRRSAPDCLKSNEKALGFIHNLKRDKREFRVLLGTNWQRYRHAIKVGDRGSYHGQMAHYWQKHGSRAFTTLGRWRVGVDVAGQAVTVPENPRKCRIDMDPYACNLPRDRALPDERGTKRWVKRNMRALAGQPGYIDVNRMCDARICLGKPKGVYTFWDEFHISASMSKWLSPLFERTVTLAGGSSPDDGGTCTVPLLCR
jgi:hypothetical protein